MNCAERQRKERRHTAKGVHSGSRITGAEHCARAFGASPCASQPQLSRVFVLFCDGELFGDCFFRETGHQKEMRSARIGA